MKKEIITKIYSRDIDHFIERYNPNKEHITPLELYENILKEIAEIKMEHPQYDEIVMNGGYDYGYYDSCTYEISFFGKRFETDEEYNKRIADNERKSEAGREAAKTAKKKEEENELNLYQELKKKFEK